MPVMPVQQFGEGGNELTTAAAASDDRIDVSAHPNGVPVVLRVVTTTTAVTVTIPPNASSTSMIDPNMGRISKTQIQQAVPAGRTFDIDIPNPAMFRDANGLITVNYSALTGASRGAYRV